MSCIICIKCFCIASVFRYKYVTFGQKCLYRFLPQLIWIQRNPSWMVLGSESLSTRWLRHNILHRILMLHQSCLALIVLLCCICLHARPSFWFSRTFLGKSARWKLLLAEGRNTGLVVWLELGCRDIWGRCPFLSSQIFGLPLLQHLTLHL